MVQCLVAASTTNETLWWETLRRTRYLKYGKIKKSSISENLHERKTMRKFLHNAPHALPYHALIPRRQNTLIGRGHFQSASGWAGLSESIVVFHASKHNRGMVSSSVKFTLPLFAYWVILRNVFWIVMENLNIEIPSFLYLTSRFYIDIKKTATVHHRTLHSSNNPSSLSWRTLECYWYIQTSDWNL